MTIDEILDSILKKKVSISRFSDGEFNFILNKENYCRYFNQNNSEKLMAKLKEVLASNNENILICLWDFFSPSSPLILKNTQKTFAICISR